jgi:hypothetical protein
MKYFNLTIIVLVVLCLETTSSAMLESPEGKVQTLTISGNTGISGVAMIGLPGDTVTDEHGLYCTEVEYGWSGTVKPTIEGYSFIPASREYSNVIADQTDENYKTKIIKYTISGHVVAFDVTRGLPQSYILSGVLMQGLPGNPVTDEMGYYTCTVDYGWAGTVKPVKESYTFNPPRLSYTKVVKDQKNQNYTAEPSAQVQGSYGEGGWKPPRVGADSRRSSRVARTTGFQPVDNRKVLVVPATEVNSKELAEIIEDMQIMSHILDERFKETRRVQGVFTDFGDFFGGDNRQTEAIYLQGYGVLFSMEVNFAFSPAPKPQPQQAAEPNEQVDSTWQKAKQQVFSPGEARGQEGPDSAEEYNSQMVEELKQDLITTLKHAANIRGVQPDEWIILTVIGSGRLAGGFGGGGFMMGGMGGMYESSPYGGTSTGGMGVYGGGSSSYGYGGGMAGGMVGGMGGFSGGMGGFGGPGVSSATVLTIRAKKADVDAYAKGEQILEQFRRKVQIFTY